MCKDKKSWIILKYTNKNEWNERKFSQPYKQLANKQDRKLFSTCVNSLPNFSANSNSYKCSSLSPLVTKNPTIQTLYRHLHLPVRNKRSNLCRRNSLLSDSCGVLGAENFDGESNGLELVECVHHVEFSWEKGGIVRLWTWQSEPDILSGTGQKTQYDDPDPPRSVCVRWVGFGRFARQATFYSWTDNSLKQWSVPGVSQTIFPWSGKNNPSLHQKLQKPPRKHNPPTDLKRVRILWNRQRLYKFSPSHVVIAGHNLCRILCRLDNKYS